ncbi:hypothetical protein K503DRAFT_768752 [Rhizopogon vinicolor AM-OR11-026]|uniref:G domain-containing protein n=1 Tax=Rhizopogon vinicolor AM-OR11-026 TaxID=1314800 RepID=A0A1B7N5W1_9AGAM|nr:hypothetical protein K503DRAFT_768752 [Rhizopogon vinicolor AM-OR11-026]
MANKSDTCPDSLYISDISVDFSQWRKNVRSAEVRIDSTFRPIDNRAGKTLSQTFSQPMKISRQDSCFLHILYKANWWRWWKNKPYDIHLDMEDIFRMHGAPGGPERKEYYKSHEEISIVLGLSRNSSTGDTGDLLPTTDVIFQNCPQFRILVTGKSGVGKSSLIKQAFGLQDALTSDLIRGEANIDNEFVSPQNNRFVLHDSKGFEAGEEDNISIVQEFIKRRSKMPLKDQLHAIWLCLEIPHASGRLLETGTEQFLALKREGKLGDIPVVIVFTKYDVLVEQVDYDMEPSLKGSNEDDIEERIKKRAETKLQEICTGPLKKFAQSDIPHVAVSTKESHKETLAQLIQITERHVSEHVAADASVMTGIAQRVDPKLKIEISIEVGKRTYWKALVSSIGFKNRDQWTCLRVLHTDIVAVWNFHDPHNYLSSEEFRTLMVNMVDKIDAGPSVNPNATMKVGLATVGTIAGILLALSGPVAPIVVPIVASVVLAKWVYDVYQLSNLVLQRFISYIVDLTMVLQTLHLLLNNQDRLSRRVIKLTLESYRTSPMSGKVHSQVQENIQGLSMMDHSDGVILDKMKALMKSYSINAGEIPDLLAEISKLRAKNPDVRSVPDEAW